MSNLERFGNDEHARWLKERAADDMYGALKALLTWAATNHDADLQGSGDDQRMFSEWSRARSAIAKAEGRGFL